MEVRGTYKLTGNMNELAKKVKAKVLAQIEAIVQLQVNAYLADLESHMGVIQGGSSHTEKGINWQALDKETLQEGPLFWYKSGAAKNSIVVNLRVNREKIEVFVGVPSSSSAYQDVLWNELGFTPQNGDHLVRRPLFIPLADIHIKELQEKIYAELGKTKMTVEI